MEEIDIIELLIRERQGKAPKRIEINGKVYIHTLYSNPLGLMYVEESNMSKYWKLNGYTIDTGITILDKPIIEELPLIEIETVTNFDNTTTITKQKAYSTDELADKINEIIKHINNN